MIKSKQVNNSKPMHRNCAICDINLRVIVNPNKTYKGGHFFGKVEIGKKKKAEYWECDECYYESQKL